VEKISKKQKYPRTHGERGELIAKSRMEHSRGEGEGIKKTLSGRNRSIQLPQEHEKGYMLTRLGGGGEARVEKRRTREGRGPENGWKREEPRTPRRDGWGGGRGCITQTGTVSGGEVLQASSTPGTKVEGEVWFDFIEWTRKKEKRLYHHVPQDVRNAGNYDILARRFPGAPSGRDNKICFSLPILKSGCARIE